MSSMSMKDVRFGETSFEKARFLVNFIGQSGPAWTDKAKGADFSDVLAQSAPGGQPPAENDAVVAGSVRTAEKTKPHRAGEANRGARDTDLEGSTKVEDGSQTANKTEGAVYEAAQETYKEAVAEMTDELTSVAISDAAKLILLEVAAELDIPEEAVLSILATLGMNVEALLDSANLGELVTAAAGADTLELMTDETLYESFSALGDKLTALVDELLVQTGLEPEELVDIITQMPTGDEASDMATAPTVSDEPQNVSNELAAKETADNAGQINIVVERGGKVTEISATVDNKGNVQTGETVVVVENVNPEEKNSTGEGTQQEPGRGETDKSAAWQLDLFNLSNKVSQVEAQLEALVMPEGADTEMIMRQIMDYMKIQLTPEVNSLEMQLHPASLGSVGVKLVSASGSITAQFLAQNEVVKAAIESQIVELKESLRSQGLKVESVEVNVESQAFDQNLFKGQGEAKQQKAGGKNGRRRIDLSGADIDELLADLGGEEQMAAEMMMANGQTVDFTA